MQTKQDRSEITVPAALLDALHGTAGESALRGAGAELGMPVMEAVTGEAGDDAGLMASDDFWASLRDYLSARGWGTISHERIHPGLGQIRAVDWAESGAGTSNPLTAGLLSGLFTTLAGREVDVLETPRSENEPDVTFVFGSPDAVGRLRSLLEDGADLSDALGRL